MSDLHKRNSGQNSGRKSCARSPKVVGMKKALKHKCFKASCGGDKRDRTADLLNAIQALSPYKSKTTPLKGSTGRPCQYAETPLIPRKIAVAPFR